MARCIANRPTAAALRVVTLGALAAFWMLSAAAQNRGEAGKPSSDSEAEAAAAPTPRLPDGTVDLGGDGIWDQSWITDFGKQLVGGPDAKIPFLPWSKAM